MHAHPIPGSQRVRALSPKYSTNHYLDRILRPPGLCATGISRGVAAEIIGARLTPSRAILHNTALYIHRRQYNFGIGT